MDAEQVFKVAAAAVELAEVFEEWIESWGVDLDHHISYELKSAYQEYQHVRDRG